MLLREATLPPYFTQTTPHFSKMSTLSRQISIDWQHSGLQSTVNVLMQINRNGHTNAESMASYIQRIAENYAVDCVSKGMVPSITGTGGWYVTFIPSESQDFDYSVEVTLMAYVVEKHLGLRD